MLRLVSLADNVELEIKLKDLQRTQLTGIWLEVVDPTKEELAKVSEVSGIPLDFLKLPESSNVVNLRLEPDFGVINFVIVREIFEAKEVNPLVIAFSKYFLVTVAKSEDQSLINLAKQRLVEVFGRTLGVYFHNAANGVDDEPVQEAGEAESISRIGTLKENSRDLEFILTKADELISDICEEVSQKHLSFKQVGIVAILSDLTVRSRSKTLEQQTTNPETLRKEVRELFEKFLADSDLEIRRIGVKISGFLKEEPAQKQLTSFFEN